MATAKKDGTKKGTARSDGASQPHLEQHGREIQAFDALRDLPLGLEADARAQVVAALNPILADSRVLHDLYKKHHWLMRGHTFYQLHLLLDEHAGQQYKLVDKIAERIQTLGGVAVGDPRHAAELTTIPRAPDGVEEVPAMLARLLDGHRTILEKARAGADLADELGDPGSEDLLSSEVIPTNELQVWFVAEHLVETPLVDATG